MQRQRLPLPAALVGRDHHQFGWSRVGQSRLHISQFLHCARIFGNDVGIAIYWIVSVIQMQPVETDFASVGSVAVGLAGVREE